MAESKTEKMRKLFADKQVSAEQLENVAGGTKDQIADDSRFLNILLLGHPAQCDRYGEKKLNYDIANNPSRYKEIRNAWAACGVEVTMHADSGNEYRAGGKYLTQSEARDYAMKRMGRTLKHSDWYWPD
ncbi:MAG: hypothetical protein IKZ66_07780 [Schwartzia sp.]|nr:hypothetical protein [Schwartzia sp. (in: firmicutes)]